MPSQKVATYDLMPEMSASGITDILCNGIEKREHDFILCNFPNGDMVGHSGNLPATIKAVETVDRCLARMLSSADRASATVIVTADHGNCELMIDPESGGRTTAHTTNPVPVVVVDPAGDRPLRAGGSLRDVGPMVLAMLSVEKPAEMTGIDLRDMEHIYGEGELPTMRVGNSASRPGYGHAQPQRCQCPGRPLPGRSPFRDLLYKQELSLLTGFHAGSEGRAGVAPAGGPLLGVRYEIRIGGPATSPRACRVFGLREPLLIQPNQTVLAQSESATGYLPGGRRTFDQPHRTEKLLATSTVLNGGIASRTDFSKGATRRIPFGTPLRSIWSGLRWVGSNRIQLRLDIADYLYQIEYPDSYFVPPVGATVGAVLAQSASKNEYTHNAVITLGVSYLFSR